MSDRRAIARRIGVVGLVAACVTSLMTWTTPVQAQQPFPGTTTACADFRLGVNLLVGDLSLFDLTDEGWVWVDRGRRLRSAVGVAQEVVMATTDTPANHDSHDLDIGLRLDPGQLDLLSEVNTDTDGDGVPDKLGIEWESGIDPDTDMTGEGQAFLPKWVWPSTGDRVWVNGHWVLDCGHADDGGDGLRYKAEIHPARAIASMRRHAMAIPGSGATPVPVTATDVYIHGRGGYVTEMLNCGMDMILGDHGDTCGSSTPPPDETYKTTPIDDDYTFDICLPPRPTGGIFSANVLTGPGNDIGGVPPVLTMVPAAGACAGDPHFDGQSMLRVLIPLEGTGVSATDVYARHIIAGWIMAPATPLARREISINRMDLHDDHEPDPGDGNLTMMWINVNRSSSSWRRLSDYALGNMDDYDDDGFFGDGLMSFDLLRFAFYVPEEGTFTLRTMGYEQDCYDDEDNFGNHRLRLAMYVGCHAGPQNAFNIGGNDGVDRIGHDFTLADLGPQDIQANGGDYEIELTIDELPLTNEDTTDLAARTACQPSAEVPLVGQALTCGSEVDNRGPGLPRQPRATTTVTGVAATITQITEHIAGPFGTRPVASCGVAGGSSAECPLLTVPFNGTAHVVTTLTPQAPGLLVHTVSAATLSAETDSVNNTASTTIEVFAPVSIQVGSGRVVTGSNGHTPIRIVSTPTFDASTIIPSSVCFGDAEAPAERACGEAHGQLHASDFDKDGDLDALLHFRTPLTGIDLGDTQACIRGRTTTGISFFGCGAIVTH